MHVSFNPASIRKAAIWFVLAVAILVGFALEAYAQSQPIGEAARQAAEQAANAPAAQASPADMLGSLISAVQLLTLLTIVLVVVLLGRVAKLTGFDPFAGWDRNLGNARMMIAFLLLFGAFLLWDYTNHAKYALIGNSASEHGKEIDSMLITTVIITGLVFIITQPVLFIFAYLFRGRPGNVASYYHDNTRLEMIWTAIPAVVLAVLVLGGVKVWNDVHKPAPAEAQQIELVGQQFQWTVRYSGADNTLGRANYKLIADENILGVDYKDKAAHDDVVSPARELVMLKGRPVNINIRAKDVLHGVYMPHFRVQMYAVPGMPTKFSFTPTVSTKEMQAQTGNPEFKYELACSQLCGNAHYNMRLEIKVLEEAEYKKWQAEQKPTYTPEMAKQLAATNTANNAAASNQALAVK
jgi:cytochrome c oxidase subunit 2